MDIIIILSIFVYNLISALENNSQNLICFSAKTRFLKNIYFNWVIIKTCRYIDLHI